MAIKMYLPPKGEKRRSFLKLGLLGGALLATGGALSWVALRPGKREPMPAGGLEVLSLAEYSVLAAVARRLLPREAPWPSPDALGVAKGCDALLAQLDETTRIQVRQLLNLFESGLNCLVSGVSAAPFTALPPESQDQVLEAWGRGRLSLQRAGYQALRRLTVSIYFGRKEAWAAAGYPGPPPFHDPNAPVWKGGGAPRPDGLGVWREPEAAP